MAMQCSCNMGAGPCVSQLVMQTNMSENYLKYMAYTKDVAYMFPPAHVHYTRKIRDQIGQAIMALGHREACLNDFAESNVPMYAAHCIKKAVEEQAAQEAAAAPAQGAQVAAAAQAAQAQGAQVAPRAGLSGVTSRYLETLQQGPLAQGKVASQAVDALAAASIETTASLHRMLVSTGKVVLKLKQYGAAFDAMNLGNNTQLQEHAVPALGPIPVQPQLLLLPAVVPTPAELQAIQVEKANLDQLIAGLLGL